MLKLPQEKAKLKCTALSFCTYQNGNNQTEGKALFWQGCEESGTQKYSWYKCKPFLMEGNSAIRITGAVRITEAYTL